MGGRLNNVILLLSSAFETVLGDNCNRRPPHSLCGLPQTLLQLPTCQHTQPLAHHYCRIDTYCAVPPLPTPNPHTLPDSFPCCVITNPRNKLGAVTTYPSPLAILYPTPPIEFVTVPIFESPILVLGPSFAIVSSATDPTTKTDASLS